MNGIKVCHLTSVHPARDTRIFSKECKSLAKRGYNVYLVATNCKEEEVDGVKIKNAGTFTRSNRIKRMSRSGKAVFKKALEVDADVYHLHDPELIPVGLKLKKLGKRIIFDSHEDVPMQIIDKEWIPKPFRKIISSLFATYEKRAFKKFDGLVSVTPSLTERLEKINSNTFQITNYPIIEDRGEDTRKWEKSICFAGGISEQWMHDKVIQAINNTGDIRYSLAGTGNANYLDSLKVLDRGHKVDFVGKIPHKEVKAFMAKSSAGVALNHYCANVGFKKGSIGNTKLFEYMGAGIPVICTDFELWKEIIDTYHCGICVDPYNVKEIEKAIDTLTGNRDMAKKMGDNGRKAVEETFNWCSQEKILFEIYDKVIS